MMRRVLWFGLLVLSALLVAAAVSAGLATRKRLTERSLAALAKKYHRGPLPCLRSVDESPSPSEAKEAAQALADTKLTGTQLAHLLGHFLKVHREREDALHDRSFVEETLTEFDELPKHVLERLYYLAVYRPRIERDFTVMQHLLEEPEVEGEAAWARLPEAQRTALSLVERAHPLCFTPRGVIAMLPTMKRLSTERQLQQWVPMVRDAQRKRRQFPVGIEDLPLSAELKNDDWGEPITVSALDAHVVLRSAGEDRTPKTDDDLVIEFDVTDQE